MAKKRWFGFWGTIILVLLLIAPLIIADKFGPRAFGVEWFACYGHKAMTIYGIFMSVAITASFIIPSFGPILSFFGGSREERRIRKTGRSARATVLAVGENSGGGVVTVNGQPYLNLVVRVEDGVSSPYEANFDAIIPRASLPQVQPGAVVKVKVDPRDPRKVVLDY